jgi:hypothetical protein
MLSKLLVTVAGAVAIVWVLWYFLAPPKSSGAPRNRET